MNILLDRRYNDITKMFYFVAAQTPVWSGTTFTRCFEKQDINVRFDQCCGTCG